MSSIATITVTPAAAADAYSRTAAGTTAADAAPTDFGATLQHALGDAVATGQDAEAKAMQAIQGGGNITEVVTAISRAQLALQSATVVRDRVVQAYQDIIKMPI
jgi:flagellar hook-basal body complex protein FliE